MSVLIKSLLRTVFLILLAGFLIAMVMPESTLHLLAKDLPLFRQVEDFLDTVATGLDIDHVVSCALVGFVAHFAWRSWRAWQLALGASLVASLCEVLQIWIPGRDPAISHAVLALFGSLLGFTIAWLLTFAWTDRSFPGEDPASTLWGDSRARD